MPNPFKDWARMYGANKQYLESQGQPSSSSARSVTFLTGSTRRPTPAKSA
jgi:hypothetical protein